MKEQTNITRERIIRKGAELIHLGGFHSTGLQDILSRAGIPKGSFYFYFKNKEDFGLAVIDYFTESVSRVYAGFLLDDTSAPVDRLDKLIIFFEALYKKTGYSLGCPIGNLSLELSDGNEKFRVKLKTSIDELLCIIEKFLISARQSGDISSDINISEAAAFMFHGFEGAVLHMKVVKNSEPLNMFKKYLYNYLQIKSAGNSSE